MPSTVAGLATCVDATPQTLGSELVAAPGEFSAAALRGVRLALEGATEALIRHAVSMSPICPGDTCLQAFALAIAGLTASGEDCLVAGPGSDPVIAPLEVLTRALQGRFEAAAGALQSRVGDEWTRATPLYRLVGLYVASGYDSVRAQALRAVTPIPPPERSGSLITGLIAARADLILGHADCAATRYESLLARCEDSGLFGAMSLAAFDALEATQDCPDRPQVRFPDVSVLGPVRELADALARRDLGAAAQAAWRQSAGSYRLGRALHLVGKECADRHDYGDARMHLVRAAEIFSSLGARTDAARSRQILGGLSR